MARSCQPQCLQPLPTKDPAGSSLTILRKPIYLEGGDEAYWEEWRQDVCRDGSTDLDQFANDLLLHALAYGHSNILGITPTPVQFAPGQKRLVLH